MSVFDVLNPLANVTPKFREDELEEIMEWFDQNAQPLLILKEGEPPVKVVTVEKILEFLALKKYHKRNFLYPSYMDMMTAIEKLTLMRMLTQDQFIYFLNLWISEPDLKHELKLAFQVFDTERRDILEIDEIAVLLSEFGDPFTEAETREILRDANVRGDGNVVYADFVDSIFNICPELYELKAEFLYDNPNEDPSVPPDPEPEPEPEEPRPPPPPPPPPRPKKEKKK